MARVSVKNAIKRLNQGGGPRPTGTIGGWPKEKRTDFEKDCVAKVLTVDQIAEKYGVGSHTVRQYKYRYLSPALKTMAVKRKVQLGESARGVLDWMINDTKDAINELRGRKTDKDGIPVQGNPKILGTLPELLGKGFEGVRLLSEILGETGKIALQQAPTNQQIINVISIPKTLGTPQFAADDEESGPDYQHMKLIDISADAE